GRVVFGDGRLALRAEQPDTRAGLDHVLGAFRVVRMTLLGCVVVLEARADGIDRAARVADLCRVSGVSEASYRRRGRRTDGHQTERRRENGPDGPHGQPPVSSVSNDRFDVLTAGAGATQV